MNITFKPLSESHFPLLLRWLEMPHLKAWWDSEIQWTPELIHQKYKTYVQGFKLEDGERKDIHAFIVCIDEKPIGYIQIYNAYDCKRSSPLINLPQSLAAFDFFMGEPDYLRKGIWDSYGYGFVWHSIHRIALYNRDPEK